MKKEIKIFKGSIFKDMRGSLWTSWNKNRKIKLYFNHDKFSISKKNVLRGLHLQTKKSQGKYISVLKGKIFDVAVDLRKHSSTYGKVFSIILSEKNSKSLFIPPGFAHGFCALAKENYVIYSCTNYRDAKSEVAIAYNDPKLKIKWPIKNPIISKKDNHAIILKEFEKKFLKSK